MISYQLREEHINREDLGSYTAFGVYACENEPGKSSREIYVPDVFLDRSRAAAFVDRCNAMQLSLEHVPDVLEDVLADAC